MRGMLLDLRGWVNTSLEALARPRVGVPRRRWSSFHVWGAVGWIAGISFAVTLTGHRGLSFWVTAGLAVAAVITFLALTMAMKIFTGGENIVYYHHEVTVVVVSSFLLYFWRQPILPYLDVVFLGLGLFLACGRLGCLMVGCCHGRPHHWGVRYREEHAEAGFSRHLVGVRLFPIQLIESLSVGVIVLVGTVLVTSGAPPGSALAWYSIAYGVARFGFEFVRGDPGRPYFGSFSEAQWSTLVLMSATTFAELMGFLPLSWWHVAVTGTLVAAMVCLAATEDSTRRLFRPRHVQQMAELIEAARSRAVEEGELYIGETSLGVRISTSLVEDEGREVDVLAFSSRDGGLSDEIAQRLADLIRQLRRVGSEADLLRGNDGVYHLILPSQRSAHAL